MIKPISFSFVRGDYESVVVATYFPDIILEVEAYLSKLKKDIADGKLNDDSDLAHLDPRIVVVDFIRSHIEEVVASNMRIQQGLYLTKGKAEDHHTFNLATDEHR